MAGGEPSALLGDVVIARSVESWGEIKAKADARAAEVENDLQRGIYVDPSAGKITLAKYVEQWLAAVTAGPTTYERYEREIRNHIVPHLGGHEVRNLTRPSSIQGWIKKVQAAGLQASSIGCVHDVLVGMLDAAVEDGLLARNPCRSSSVKLPKQARKPVVPWTLDRVQAVISLPPRPLHGRWLAGLRLRIPSGRDIRRRRRRHRLRPQGRPRQTPDTAGTQQEGIRSAEGRSDSLRAAA
jgi:hypothetical protein